MKEILWHAISADDALRELKTSLSGLSSSQARARLASYGPNTLPGTHIAGALEVLVNQVKNPLAWVLLLAVGASFFLGERVDAFVILLALLINVALGYIQESKANKAVFLLRKYLQNYALVKRDGVAVKVPTREVVPGDILLLSSGDKVSADARILEAYDFEVNEAPLTGESEPVRKTAEKVSEGMSTGDRINMVFSGTSILRGKAIAVTVLTGTATEFGKIAESVRVTKEAPTPLQKELAGLSRTLGIAVSLAALILFAIGLAFGRSLLEMFTTSIAVAVAAIPEGLPLAVTAILAIGMQKIAKQKALTRKLIATETLGSVTVICTDKTGTITAGEMRVNEIWTPDGGEVAEKKTIEIGVLANEAVTIKTESGVEIIGDAEDKALLLAGSEAGISRDALLSGATISDQLPFDSSRKYMALLIKADGGNTTYIKGAPETILKNSSRVFINGVSVLLDDEARAAIKNKINEVNSEGLRTLAFAFREEKRDKFEHSRVGGDEFIFTGVATFKDPLRKGVKEVIRSAQIAGVRTVMITGDHRETAVSIARAAGLETDSVRVIEGKEMENISDEELKERIKIATVFARVLPEHKVRIVEALRATGEVVAMVGDGVNDAPALKVASIGIAQGSGTDVAKEVSDVVLLDNNLKTIVRAIREGRTIFDNIRKVVLYLLASSFSEVVIIAGSILMRLPLPVLPAQILWVNLVEDALPNMALAFDPGDKSLMKEPPRKPNTPLLSSSMIRLIVTISIVADSILFILFLALLKKGLPIDEIRTFMFAALGMDSLFFIFVVRSLHRPFWQTNPFSNVFLFPAIILSLGLLIFAVHWPPLQAFLHTVPLSFGAWSAIISLAILKMFFIEFLKWRFLNHKKA